jgi:hypothetical protein
MNNGAEVFEVDGFDSEDGTPMGACRVVLEKDYAAILAERDRMSEAVRTLLTKEISSSTIQQCCICYGGSSFSGPMKEALECDRAILLTEFEATLAARAALSEAPK